MAQPANQPDQQDVPDGYSIKGYEKKILHTYNISGKQIKDEMEITIHDSITNKKWYKKYTQIDFTDPIKAVYGTIKQANANDNIKFTYPDDNPDTGCLLMDCAGEYALELPPQ